MNSDEHPIPERPETDNDGRGATLDPNGEPRSIVVDRHDAGIWSTASVLAFLGGLYVLGAMATPTMGATRSSRLTMIRRQEEIKRECAKDTALAPPEMSQSPEATLPADKEF